jgi:hypothetical protein
MKKPNPHGGACVFFTALVIFIGSAAGWFGTLRVASNAADQWHSSSDYIGPIVLDKLFGIPYYFANATGHWHSGPSWFKTAPVLSVFCFFLWPIISLLLLSSAIGGISLYFLNKKTRSHRAIAVILPVVIILVILLLQAPLAQDSFSYLRYSFANW